MESAVNFGLVALLAFAGGFVVRGYMLWLKATAKVRALKAVNKEIALIDKIRLQEQSYAELAAAQASEKAQIDALKARVAAL